MRDLMVELGDGDYPAAGDSNSLAFDGLARNLGSGLASLLQLFVGQLTAVRSIIAIEQPSSFGQSDGEGALCKLNADRTAISEVARLALPPAVGPDGMRKHSLESLSEQARQLCCGSDGDDLLVLQERTLETMMAVDGDIGFRAIAVLPSRAASNRNHGWRLQRALFDRGLINIGSVQCGEREARCFLASDAIRSFDQFNHFNGASRGQITMSGLGQNGAFANQVFQYAYVKLYAFRHGLTAAIPDWVGRKLYGLKDPLCSDVALRQFSFNGFTDDDLRLWDLDDPPIDIDLWGYFQETPKCWQRHRPLLRRMFTPSIEAQNSIDAWHNEVTHGRQRTLVAIHVRRGDYRRHELPYFRLVPEDFYLDWLRRLWPTLSDPLLFVATDEPDEILPHFNELSPISELNSLRELPAHIRDFEILRRADYLAICNSSFSRMAAILARSTQRCFLPSFETKRFARYEPWVDPGFWARFAEKPRIAVPRKPTPVRTTHSTISFDISDLLLYLLDHPTLTGIQRVQCELLRHLADPPNNPVRFVILNDEDGLASIERSALLDLIDRFRSVAISTAQVREKVLAILSRALPCTLGTGEVFLTIGAFWAVRGTGRLLQHLKNSGAIIGLFTHDIIPITHPEYFQARDNKVFVKAVVEALTFADFVLTSSAYNKAAIASHCASRGSQPLPVHVVPLAHELTRLTTAVTEISDVVADIIDSEYVLCVGTIEVRKNPTYLFNIWKLMAQSDRANIPTLVFAGGKGWLVRDFIEQLEICNYLDGRIVILNNVTDAELDQLYRRCLLTMFPSFAEGWGLPVGESLAYGKVCICAAAGGIPEVGKAFADYVDPYNVRSGLEQLLRYLDNPELRRRREDKIVECFQPRSWRQVAEDLVTSIPTIASQVQPSDAIAAITLPPNKFIPISINAGAVPLDGADGSLSAELACVSGWRVPQAWGVWADQPETTLRFRATSSWGSKIHLILRLAAAEGASYRIRISSGSGAETVVSLRRDADILATLPCEVERDGLVTVRLSLVSASEDVKKGGPYWYLKGLLYFEPQGVGGEAREIRDRNAAPIAALVERVTAPEAQSRLQLISAVKDEGCRAASHADFLHSRDCFWTEPPVATDYEPPMFADSADEEIFFSRYRNSQTPPLGAVTESMTLLRRSEQYVSMSKFSEGTIFDRSGVHRGFGFIEGAPLSNTPWLLRDASGISVEERSLAKAPLYEKSCLIFYNGNLHNYYHWLAEGLLLLDILSRSMAPAHDLCIPLPKSMDINALFDHRDMLQALGFANVDIVEVADSLIKVQEAIWVESDLIEQMPATYLKSFQRRISSKYAGVAGTRNRRLLVERKGPTRKIQNFDEVQAFLTHEGFETVFLEGMSIREQILLFQSAEFVIGTHGAGLTNLLFCEPGTKVLEFMPSVEMRPFFWLISEGLNLRHAVQFCSGADGDSFKATLNVDISKLKAFYRMVDGGCRSVA